MRTFVIAMILILLGGAAAAALFAVYHSPLNMGDPSPDQPVAFSHKLHAGENRIHCLYCHVYAERSPSAGVPDMETCRNCHLIVGRDKPEVKKVMEYWNRKEPISWVKVHDLPDHVYFPHFMHLNGGVPCSQCHGEVEAMEKIERVSSLKMGWCLTCHREKGASIDCWTCHI
jgi:hypothetical protein